MHPVCAVLPLPIPAHRLVAGSEVATLWRANGPAANLGHGVQQGLHAVPWPWICWSDKSGVKASVPIVILLLLFMILYGSQITKGSLEVFHASACLVFGPGKALIPGSQLLSGFCISEGGRGVVFQSGAMDEGNTSVRLFAGFLAPACFGSHRFTLICHICTLTFRSFPSPAPALKLRYALMRCHSMQK